MAKGSQLTQLKSALSQAGFTGHKLSGKKRKRLAASDTDKEKRSAKLEEIHKRLNPFDAKVTKLKHDVGGRRLKGVKGKPAQSKQHGIEQRKRTLLKEYEEKNRAGGIVDRRFGENDPTMGIEDRMLERFTRERQRASKGAAFNLEDEDDLTHYGRSLSKLDDFDEVGLGLESDEDEEFRTGQIDREVVSRMHFGGFGDDEEENDGQPARKKSKAEVMAEVMAKSKEHKLRRQLEKVHEDDIREKLDEDFAVLRDLIYAPDPSSTGSNSVPLGVARGVPAESNSRMSNDSVPVALTPAVEGDDYDLHVRELAFDKRSKPKDRTKTEEEIALAEKEALEKAEGKRQKRMLGLDENDSEAYRENGKRQHGGDDLEDDYEGEGDGLDRLGAGLMGVDEGEGVNEKEEEDEEEDEDEDMSASGSEDSGESSAEDLEQESGAEEGEHEELVATSSKRLNKQSRTESASKELPFTFPCPSNHDQFLDIVDNIREKEVPIVVQRIRTLYHTSLAEDNKFKLQTLGKVLIDHILYITSPPIPHFSLLSSLLPHITAITSAYPVPIARHLNDKLSLMYKNLKRGIAHGALDADTRTWPGLPELSLLRIIGALWSTSDMNHAVVSPTRVLMGAYLGLGRIRGLPDIASGLFLCTLFLHFETLSTRFVPEAVNFLANAALHLAPHGYKDTSALPGSFPVPDFRLELYRRLALRGDAKATVVVRKANLAALLNPGKVTEQAKADLLGLVFDLLGRFANMYKGLEGFPELYTAIHEMLLNIETNKLIDGHKTQLSLLLDMLSRLLKFAKQTRRPLLLQTHKPIPIATYIPKFESTSTNYMRRQDPDHERNEAKKLRHQYKQERKGAIRELRKDARFLAGVEQQKQAEKDRIYTERMRRVFGSIEGERAEEKAMEREKVRDKRRAGRK